MDDRLEGLYASATALADGLGLESEALRAAFLGAFGPEEGGTGVRTEALAEFLGKAASRVGELAESERRARQAAHGIRASGFAFASSLETATILEALLDYLNWLVPYEGASVLFLEEGGDEAHRFSVAAAREWRRLAPRGLCEDEIASAIAAVEKKAPVSTRNGAFRRLVLPLLGPTGPLGAVLLIRADDKDYDEEQIRVAEAFAGQAAAAVRNAKLYCELKATQEELVKSYDSSIEVLSHTLDLRDHETEGHSLRVAELATRLGSALGLEGRALEELHRGALLHDIGKIGIPDTILLKPGPLSDEERGIMMRHPDYARNLLENISFLAPSLEVPYCHHERWDGSGYPRGLSGEEIPLAARIFAVVDIWDALVHDRPYRKALSPSVALEQLAALSGSHLDPKALSAFLAMEPDRLASAGWLGLRGEP